MKFKPEQKAHPQGFWGRVLLRKMGKAHLELDSWAIDHIEIKNNFTILDAGFGNGDNLKRYLTMTKGLVYGVDTSKLCVKVASKKNKKELKNGRLKIYNYSILDFKLPSNSLDLISAFCTIGLWDNLDSSLLKILELLKPNGTFLIADYGRYDVNAMLLKLEGLGFKNVRRIVGEKNFNLILATK